MKIAVLIWLMACCPGAPVLAEETRTSLIAQIEQAGQNEYGDERHAIKVDDCQVTTFRWKKLDDEGWVLWTSFKFPMMLVDISEFKTDQGLRNYMFLEGDPGLIIIEFKGRDGFEFIHEKPFHRPPKGDIELSPRGDGTTHYFERKSSGMIIQQGPDVEEKAHLFTNGYIRYARTYCDFVG